MKVEVVKCNLKYPLYACKFISDDLLLVTGGGGEGNNGIDNKITLLSIDNNKIKKFRELKLSADSDSPTCMDFIHFSSNVQDSLPNSILLGSSDIQDDIKVDGVFLLGCNENSSKIMQSNINNSLQRFNYENQHMRFIASVDYDKDDQSPRDLNTYLKFLKISENIEFAACCTSKVPSIIRIINPITLNELYEIDTGNELRDFDFQKGKQAKILSYITKNSCELISCVTGTFITKSYHFDVNKYTPLKLKFIKEDCFFIILKNDIANKFEFHLFSITGEIKLLKVHELKNLKFKGITSVDYAYETDILAISGNDNSVNFFHLFYKQSNPHNHSAVISALTNSKMKYLKKFSDLHTFAITKIAFNDSGSRLSTVSADNSASIINIPKNFKNHKPTTKKFLSFIFNLIMLAILGVAGKFIYENGLHIIAKDALIEFNNETFQPLMKDKVIPFIKERMNRNKQNDTEYFKLKDNEYNDEYNEVTILSKDIEPTSTNPLSYSTSTKPLSYSTSSEASFTTSKLVNQDYYDQVVEGGDDEEAISYEDYLLSLNDIVSVEVTTSGYESRITSVVVTQSTGVVEEPKVVEESEVVVDSEVVKKTKVVEEPAVQEPKVVEEVVAEETETVVEEPKVIEVTETVVEVETATSQPPATAEPQVQIQTVPNVEENIEEILNVTTDPVAAPTSVVERKAKIQTVPNVEENVEEILAAATEPVSTAAIEPQAVIQTVPNVEEKVEEILIAAIEPEVQIQTVPNVEEDVEAILKATAAPTSVSTTSEPDVQVETVDDIEEKLKAPAVETPAPAVTSDPEPQVEETTVYKTPVAAEYESIVETVGELKDVPTDSYDHDRAMRIQKMLPEEVDVHLPEAVVEEMASNNQENTVETIVEEAVETATAIEHAVPKDLNEALEALYEANEHIEEELALDEL